MDSAFGRLNEQLLELGRKARESQKLRRMLDRAQLELERQRSRLADLGRRLHDEVRDVERLEGLSLAALFHTIVGSGDRRITRERREALTARLRYDECKASVEPLEREVSDLSARLRRLDVAQERYERLLAEKEQRIARESGPAAERLLRLTEDLTGTEAAIKEIEEAVEAGQQASRRLRAVVSLLEAAPGWGALDRVTGGLVSAMAEPTQVDEAKEEAGRAQQSLRRFQRELADVLGGLPTGFTLDVERFSGFSDGFFDGLMRDWTGGSGTSRSRESVEEMAGRVRQTVEILEQRLHEFHGKARSLAEQRRALIEGA